MDLETIIMSEAIQTQKDKLCMFSFIHGDITLESSDPYVPFRIATEEILRGHSGRIQEKGDRAQWYVR